MRERPTARVLLLDPEDRILLMKGRLPSDRDGVGGWFTLGGGAEPGETMLAAAAREVREETGFADVEIGPVIFEREAVFHITDGPALFKETYFSARCGGGEISRAGWQALEHELIDDIRWWTLDELAASAEPVFPEGLAELLRRVLAGEFAGAGAASKS